MMSGSSDEIAFQRCAFERFVDGGLENVFRSVLPLQIPSGLMEVAYAGHVIGERKHGTAAITLTVQLMTFEATGETRSILDVFEEHIHIADLPMMTEQGTFIVDGRERAIKPQRRPATGVLMDASGSKVIDLCDPYGNIMTFVPEGSRWQARLVRDPLTHWLRGIERIPEDVRCSDRELGAWFLEHVAAYNFSMGDPLDPVVLTEDLITEARSEKEPAPSRPMRVWWAGDVLAQATWIGLRSIAATLQERMRRAPKTPTGVKSIVRTNPMTSLQRVIMG